MDAGTPSRRGPTVSLTPGPAGLAAPHRLRAGRAACPPACLLWVSARAHSAGRLAAPARRLVPRSPSLAAVGGTAGPWLVIGRSAGAPLLRPLRRGERSGERRSAGATMAGVWVGAAALVAAGWRGRRSPHRLMRGAALWTLKVRRAGAPSLAPPRGAPCRRERPGGSRRQPRPGSAAFGIRRLSLPLTAGFALERAARATPAAAGAPGLAEGGGAPGAGGLGSPALSAAADSHLAAVYLRVRCTGSCALRFWLRLELSRVCF